MVPYETEVAIAARWKSRIIVSKQGLDDYACGLHCIATAALALGTLNNFGAADEGVSQFIENNSEHVRCNGPVCSRGLVEPALSTVIEHAHLTPHQLDPQGERQLTKRDSNSLWMILVSMTLTDPQNAKALKQPYNHYVLILEYISDGELFVVADPHPWNPDVYCVHYDELINAWTGQYDSANKWAARLSPKTASATG